MMMMNASPNRRPHPRSHRRRRALAGLAASVALTCACAGALAQADLAMKKNCLACHAVDKKLLGPAYKDVAARYAGDKDAVAKLSKKVREGGVGVWGNIPMPANTQVNQAEAESLVRWVLSQK